MDPEAATATGSPLEAGYALLPSGSHVEEYRRRVELPSRVGRYVLAVLGALTVGAGVGIWLAHPGPVPDALLVFGLLLLLLGYVQHRMLLRDRSHWPVEGHLWEEGLELVLANGEIRATPWNEPKFVLDLYARPIKGGPDDEFLLVWKMDSKVPMCPITAEAFHRIRERAVSHGLEFSEFSADNRRRTLRGFEVRSPASPVAPPAQSTHQSHTSW